MKKTQIVILENASRWRHVLFLSRRKKNLQISKKLRAQGIYTPEAILLNARFTCVPEKDNLDIFFAQRALDKNPTAEILFLRSLFLGIFF
jgi:hypothetical protein